MHIGHLRRWGVKVKESGEELTAGDGMEGETNLEDFEGAKGGEAERERRICLESDGLMA